MEMQITEIMSYHHDSRKLTKVTVEETGAIVWTLTCKREDLSELESHVIFAITCLNDCGILIGRGKSCSQGQAD